MADILVGPYPETRDRYRARSPIHFVDQASCPAIILQGLEDRICPASQAESMVAALRARGVPVAYVPFAGEQHGYRSAENIQRALDAELYFYGRVFGFRPADPIEPVIIENLSRLDRGRVGPMKRMPEGMPMGSRERFVACRARSRSLTSR